MTEIREFANAKINLYLEVLRKRDDGYHEIETVMTTVNLADDVLISPTNDGVDLECDFSDCKRCSDLPRLSLCDNLAYTAAKAFFGAISEKGIPHGGANIKIKKKIPVKSGLAGGSADAAAVLRGLNALFDSPLNYSELTRLACELGADVPFCLTGGTALCGGIGEKIVPIKAKFPFHGVIAIGNEEKLSTGAAYSLVDKYNLQRKDDRRSPQKTVKALESGDFDALSKSLFNVFDVACAYESEAKSIMMREGCQAVSLSGAGPAFFALTENESHADAVSKQLEREGFTSYSF